MRERSRGDWKQIHYIVVSIMNPIILIVEDDLKIRSGLRDNFELEGFTVLESWNAEAGRKVWVENNPDIVILDLMLPGKDGYSLLRTMRSAGFASPVLILSARGEEWDKVKGFRLGCDDYVVKPFSVIELIARINALLRRVGNEKTESDRIIIGNIRIDVVSREVFKDEEKIDFPGLEFDLILFLARNLNRVVSRKELLRKIWGVSGELDTRTVDVHIGNLRKKLAGFNAEIETVYKAGYRLQIAK